MMSMVPVAFLSIGVQSRLVHQLTIDATAAAADMTGRATEILTNIRTVRGFSRERYERLRFAERVQVLYGLSKRGAVIAGVATIVTWLCVNVTFRTWIRGVVSL
jgi:ABC-type multidrug transport system fused ATPase/permease subunit